MKNGSKTSNTRRPKNAPMPSTEKKPSVQRVVYLVILVSLFFGLIIWLALPSFDDGFIRLMLERTKYKMFEAGKQFLGVWLVIASAIAFFLLRAFDSWYKTPPSSSTKALRFADKLLILFLSRAESEAIIGDLQESFPKWLKMYGAKNARMMYLKETITAIRLPILKLLAKLGILGFISKFHF